MATVYIGNKQHAEVKQKRLYKFLLAKAGETKTSMSTLAEECCETRQRFKYRFDNEILEAWEILVLFDVMGITADELRRYLENAH